MRHSDGGAPRAVAGGGPGAISSKTRSRSGKPLRLHPGEFARQFFALKSHIKLAMAPIQRAGPGLDEILRDQLLQHAIQALLGDAQDFQQRGDRQSGLPADEMQHAVVGAPEAIGLEESIGVADEVSIGEIEQFDQIVHRRVVGFGRTALFGSGGLRHQTRH
jgi:hypothetical protein